MLRLLLTGLGERSEPKGKSPMEATSLLGDLTGEVVKGLSKVLSEIQSVWLKRLITLASMQNKITDLLKRSVHLCLKRYLCTPCRKKIINYCFV